MLIRGWGVVLTVRTKRTQGGGGGGGTTPPPGLPRLGQITGLSARKSFGSTHIPIHVSWGGGGPDSGRSGFSVRWTDPDGTSRSATTTRFSYNIWVPRPSRATNITISVQALGNNSTHGNGPTASTIISVP